MMPTLLLVGHGSRDHRSAGELRALADRVRAAGRELPGRGFEVRIAFLELSEPLLEEVLAQVSGDVVVVPLLLGSAFHATADLPDRLAEVERSRPDLSITQTAVLGPDPLLDAAVCARTDLLVAQGCDAVVLLGTGSSHERANAEVDAVAARVAAAVGVPVAAGFVTAEPKLADAVDGLRAGGAARIGLVPWFLAPGRLLDAGLRRAADLGVDAHATTLAADDRLVDIVLSRAMSAVCARSVARAA